MAKAKTAHQSVFINDIVTPVGRISFPHLDKPDTNGAYADDKYKVSLLIPKDADIKALKEAVLRCAAEAWPGKKLGLRDLQHPFRNGDDKGNLAGYPGNYYITCKTKHRPLVVDTGRRALDPVEVYGGCYGRLVVTACSYEQAGKPGVTFLLTTVQKTKDGVRFGGSSASAVDALDDGLIDDEGADDALPARKDGNADIDNDADLMESESPEAGDDLF